MAVVDNFWSILLCLLTLVSLVSCQSLTYITQPTYVAEDPTVLTKLVKLDCTPSASATVQSCRVKTSNPGGPFAVQENPPGEFWVIYDATQNLNYASTNFYELTLDCTDSSNKQSNTISLFVYVTPNTPPTITNYPTDKVTRDVSTFDYTTDTVYQVVATDAEKDTLTYSILSQQPSSGLFTINSATGKITATKDLKLTSTPSYILTVEVSDGKNTISDFHVIITVNNLNVAPVILNLPTSINVAEDAGLGTTLIKLSIEDTTMYNTPLLTTTCSTSPSSEAYKFTLSSDTITLSANNLLNYEVRSIYTITCTTTDGYFSSDGKDVLTVNVVNVNENPYFNSNQYYCTLVEGAMRDHYCSLTLTVTDPEGETISDIGFLTSSNSGNFYFDKSTNRIYFDREYDIDAGSLPTSVSLTLQAKDSAGGSATASVLITVTDDNDNTCAFDKTLLYKQVDQNTALGQLDSFTVTDADVSSPNKDTKVEIVSTSPADTGTYITVTGAGELYYIGTIPTSKTDSSYTMVVRCKDLGSPSRSALATVVVSYTYVTTTTTTTTTTTIASTTTTAKPVKSIWDYDWFIAVFAIFMVLLAALLIAALSYLIYKCCCRPKPDYAQRGKVSPDLGEKRISRRGYYDDDEDFMRTARSEYNNGRSWQSAQPLSARQIPALEYR
ncbi:hypothetical protein Btru_069513 [Bulinus truncatus]|nr:hypothetical protein Btru_069513 [Bulinus truncatus]